MAAIITPSFYQNGGKRAMPKKRKYPWYKARECFRVQKSMPDGKVKTLYAKTEEEMDRKLAALNEELAAGVDHAYNPTVA